MVDREAVFKLMNESSAVYLATVDGSAPRIRALVNLRRSDLYPTASQYCREQGATVFLTTSAASAKVRELRANPAAAVYYCDPNRYQGVSFSGRVEILTDPELKRALWCEDWRFFWPGGADDPDYVVIRMKPASAEGWWNDAPFEVEVDKL